MRVTLLHSPSAGDDDQPDRAELERLIATAGHEVRYHSLARSGWTAALARRADLIAVAGGDGSVGRVARHLVGRRVPIAVLPTGTANNVARTLGLDTTGLSALIGSWAASRRIAFDLGVARGPWGRRHFLEGAGFGLFSQALAREESGAGPRRLDDAAAELRRILELLRKALRAARPVRVQAALDGRDISGSYLLFEAMIGQHVGPRLRLAPEAVFDDGRFDLVLVAQDDRADLQRALAAWQAGSRRRPQLRTLRGRKLSLEWTGFPLHIDDLSWPPETGKRYRRPVEIHLEITRRSVTFLVPARKRARRDSSRAR